MHRYRKYRQRRQQKHISNRRFRVRLIINQRNILGSFNTLLVTTG